MIKKGGDIDLEIESKFSKDEFNLKKGKLVFLIEDTYPEIEFDIINLNQTRDPSFSEEIESTKVLINHLNNQNEIETR
jgi:hypothetical protein